METRKTNLGVEYELELSEFGNSSVKVIATFPNVESEWKEFEIKINNPHRLANLHDTEDVSDSELLEAQKYINEQAIMYISMELAKLMGEGRIVSINIASYAVLSCVLIDKQSIYHTANGLPQIEELIKQIRYS